MKAVRRLRDEVVARTLDAALAGSRVREWMIRRGERELRRSFLVENRDNMPPAVGEMRVRVLSNLLRSIDHAVRDGRIAPRVRRRLVRTLIGAVLTGEEERVRPFFEAHGYLPPTLLTISPTKRCNLRCTGCYAACGGRNDNTMSREVFQRLLYEKNVEWGSHFSVISGGEPFMYRSEGADLIEVLSAHGSDYFMVYSNGTLIDERAAERLAEAGNITVAFSVEGWREQTDQRRGKGVFDKVLRGMANLRATGVPFGISVTATRHNAETILSRDFMDFLFDEQGAIYGWVFQYMPIGSRYTLDLMVTPEQRKRMLERELDLVFENDRFLVDFWNGGPFSLGCIAAGRSRGYFYVNWDGDISPCVFFPYAIANLNDMYASGRTISSVLETEYFRRIREWQKKYTGEGNAARVRNLFRPCPIKDHHRFAADLIKRSPVRPLDEDAATALEDEEYHRRLIEHDGELADLLDPIWEQRVAPLPQEKESPSRAGSRG